MRYPEGGYSHDDSDEIREDFSWLMRNGLAVRPAEHVIVKRMAADPLAADWANRLELIHLHSPENQHLDADTVQRIADEMAAAFEGIAQGQLEIVLSALDGVRAEILTALGTSIPEASAAPPPSGPSTDTPERPEQRQSGLDPGRLF